MVLVADYADCVDDGYPKRQIYVLKPCHCTYLQFVPLHMNIFKAFFFFFFTTTYLSRFQCGHPWWHNKYPVDV